MSAEMKLAIKCANPGHATQHKIPAIKALRAITLVGLKEAKDAIESCIDGATFMCSEASSYAREEYANNGSHYAMGYEFEREVTNLFLAGFTVEADTFKVKIQALAKQAIDSGEYQVAIDLVEVLRARY